MSNSDRLTAIKAELAEFNAGQITFQRRHELVGQMCNVDLPWAVSRLEQLQEDVQGLLGSIVSARFDADDPERAAYDWVTGLLQAALDRSKEDRT